jgi:protein TonB
MFEDSLFESSGKLAERNPWTTAFSFALEMLAAGFVVLLPLIYTEALPKQQLLSFLEAPVPPPAAAPTAARIARPAKPSSDLDHGVLRPPAEVPRTTGITDEKTPPSNDADPPKGVPGGVSDGVENPVIAGIIRSTPVASPKAPVQKIPISSGVAQGWLVYQVKPQYPSLARQARIQGTVVLQAVIGIDGTVQNLNVLTGHPMLNQAAIEAVRQWRYKPYYLNGKPIEVDTQISVNFTLTGG